MYKKLLKPKLLFMFAILGYTAVAIGAVFATIMAAWGIAAGCALFLVGSAILERHYLVRTIKLATNNWRGT